MKGKITVTKHCEHGRLVFLGYDGPAVGFSSVQSYSSGAAEVGRKVRRSVAHRRCLSHFHWNTLDSFPEIAGSLSRNPDGMAHPMVAALTRDVLCYNPENFEISGFPGVKI